FPDGQSLPAQHALPVLTMIKLTYEGVTVETETVGQAVDIIKGLTAQPVDGTAVRMNVANTGTVTAGTIRSPEPVCSDWFKWYGRANPPTFDSDVAAVSLKFRNGQVIKYLPSTLRLMDWTHRDHPLDIV